MKNEIFFKLNELKEIKFHLLVTYIIYKFLKSWEKIDRNIATFTPEITPLILAAHRNNYEILKILLDRGATLPMPHDVR